MVDSNGTMELPTFFYHVIFPMSNLGRFHLLNLLYLRSTLVLRSISRYYQLQYLSFVLGSPSDQRRSPEWQMSSPRAW